MGTSLNRVVFWVILGVIVVFGVEVWEDLIDGWKFYFVIWVENSLWIGKGKIRLYI